MKKTLVLVITTVATLAMTAAAMGQGPAGRPDPDKSAVNVRKALMTLISSQQGPLTAIQRGRAPYDQALVKKNAANLVTLAGMIPDAFEHDTSNATDVKTEAMPVVWQSHDDFLTHAHALRTQAAALEKAARGGNEDDVKAAIKDVSGACGSCHMKYRNEKK